MQFKNLAIAASIAAALTFAGCAKKEEAAEAAPAPEAAAPAAEAAAPAPEAAAPLRKCEGKNPDLSGFFIASNSNYSVFIVPDLHGLCRIASLCGRKP